MEAVQALELAYGKGCLKKYALEKAIIETLYSTTDRIQIYLKLIDLNNLSYDEETKNEYIIKFGYRFRAPVSGIQLHISKEEGKMWLTKDEFGFGFAEVEESVCDYIKENFIRKGILCLQTNYNDQQFLIK